MLKKSKNVLFGDIFNDGKQYGADGNQKGNATYAVVRIDAKSDLTAEKVKTAVEGLEKSNGLIIVILPEKEAREKWAKGVRRFDEVKKGMKRTYKRKR